MYYSTYVQADLRLCWSHIPQLEILCLGSYLIYMLRLQKQITVI